MKTIKNSHTVPLDGLPTEFRILKAGLNETTKGTMLFDATAARTVMAKFAEQGVDQPIDLEHDSLDTATRRTRADASNALGWYRLALRNGELWAVDVRWNAEGSRRLNAKTQRYVSPALLVDDEGRVVEMINCALVAMPATHGTPALVAASKFGRANSSVIATRVPVNTRTRVAARAMQSGMTLGNFVRELVTLAAAPESEKTLASVIAALGLPDDASPAVVKAALDELLRSLEPKHTNPTDSPAESLPQVLSDYERKLAADISDPAKRKRFIALRTERAKSRRSR